MRCWPLWLLTIGLGCSPCARADDIAAVLLRSQQVRLDVIELAGEASTRRAEVQASFDRLASRAAAPPGVELRVSAGPGAPAETLRGEIIVANETLADLPETQRLFVLAHELGHVALNHWSQMGQLFQKWVPGDVTPQRTDPVAAALGAEASRLAHQQEYEADAFALRLLRGMGLPRDEVLAVFKAGGAWPDTATHPGSRRRYAALLAIAAVDDATRRRAAAPSGR